jgi:arsenate reductase
MAEGFVNALYGERYRAFSAGTEPSVVNPYAVRAMQEIGIDISGHRSKSVDEFLHQDLDYVVTVCDHAREACPSISRVAASLCTKAFRILHPP